MCATVAHRLCPQLLSERMALAIAAAISDRSRANSTAQNPGSSRAQNCEQFRDHSVHGLECRFDVSF
jgi:hypothetical protein